MVIQVLNKLGVTQRIWKKNQRKVVRIFPKLSVVNIHHSLPTNCSNLLTFDCFSSQKSGSENLAELFLMFLCLLDFVLCCVQISAITVVSAGLF